MDSAANSIPPIPRPTRQVARKSHHGPHTASSAARADGNRATATAAATPEVISSLITSLSAVSKPADNLFEAPTTSLSAPGSPREGSFGVDYGAFSQPSDNDYTEANVPLDELAASPPVIRTAKPPSGFSPLTAPKSPRESGFKSILGKSSSRPSSKGSLASKDADAQSIGNVSIERGVAPIPELKRQRSHDSWGKKQGRNHKGLMYMSSKERLREKEFEKKRASVGAVGGNPNGLGGGASSRPDPFLAETAITEEPSVHSESPTRDKPEKAASIMTPEASSPRPIPTRDSSLRKTGTNAKRSSTRSSRTKRDSEGTILEIDENGRPLEIPKRRHHARGSEAGTSKKSMDLAKSDVATPSKGSPTASKHGPGNSRVEGIRFASHIHSASDADVEDGAPFPAVAQGRRRDRTPETRRKSGRHTPDPLDAVRPKRSNSKLKRLSGPLSPRSEEKSTGGRRDVTSPEPGSSVPHGYERPQSADSIDDAVESYLCSPRLSQKIRHPQTGRVISFSEVGDSDGSAVFCCVGMGLTRYITAFYDELALTLKLRLITPDRPGVGDSEPYADGTATPLSWPDDVYAICQALKITKFSILAHSAGAIYALATALRMPQHIRGRIHLLAPWIPPSQMNVFGASQSLPPTNAIPTSQRILRALPTPILKAANSSFMSATSSSITSSLPKSQRRGKRKSTAVAGRDAPALPGRNNVNPSMDKENLGDHNGKEKAANEDHAPSAAPASATTPVPTGDMDLIRPQGTTSAQGHINESAILAAAVDAMADKERQMTYDDRLTHAIWELATTGANPAVDLLVCLERRHTIGFRYVDITRPVVIHHGSRDTRVPVENVKWLGKTMRRCEVRVLEGEGHGLMASAGVMGAILMEISKEWEDWMRVTGSGARNGERRRAGTGAR